MNESPAKCRKPAGCLHNLPPGRERNHGRPPDQRLPRHPLAGSDTTGWMARNQLGQFQADTGAPYAGNAGGVTVGMTAVAHPNAGPTRPESACLERSALDFRKCFGGTPRKSVREVLADLPVCAGNKRPEFVDIICVRREVVQDDDRHE